MVQHAHNFVDSGTSLTCTLSAFGSSLNATAGGFSWNLAVGGEAVGSGFTGFTSAGITSATNSIKAEWRTGEDDTVDMTWSSTDGGGIAVEIKSAMVTVPILFNYLDDEE